MVIVAGEKERIYAFNLCSGTTDPTSFLASTIRNLTDGKFFVSKRIRGCGS